MFHGVRLYYRIFHSIARHRGGSIYVVYTKDIIHYDVTISTKTQTTFTKLFCNIDYFMDITVRRTCLLRRVTLLLRVVYMYYSKMPLKWCALANKPVVIGVGQQVRVKRPSPLSRFTMTYQSLNLRAQTSHTASLRAEGLCHNRLCQSLCKQVQIQ